LEHFLDKKILRWLQGQWQGKQLVELARPKFGGLGAATQIQTQLII